MSKKNVIEQMIGLLRTPIAQRKGINIPSDECLIWAGELEKELKSLMSNSNKAQKSADMVEPKFHEGDWIVFNGLTLYVNEVVQGYYRTTSIGGIPNSYDWNIDNVARLWTVQDAKDGDVLCDYHEAYDNPLIFILKNFEHVNFGLVTPSDYSSYCFLTAGDRQRFKEGTYHHKHNIKPATTEQRDLLFQKMREAGYKWNTEKKELEKIELAKSESEEELSDFEAALFSAFSDGWQQYLHGEEVDVAQWAKEHSAELLEVAKQNK